MLSRYLFLRLTLFAVFFFGSPAIALAQETFYYWVVPFSYLNHTPKESFVIQVTLEQAAEIEAIRAQPGHLPGFAGRVVPTGVDYNRNYHAPGHPTWHWHIAPVEEIFDHYHLVWAACASCTSFLSNPSDIEANPQQWISNNDNEDIYGPQYYYIEARVYPGQLNAVVNVSNRGVAGSGDNTLISGVIVNGGEPRTLVLRVLGPSLAAAGVQNAATDPRLRLYSGPLKIVENNDWQGDSRAGELSQRGLAPSNTKEAALLITLAPGAYTIHGINNDSTNAVVLIEVYDVDSPATAPGH